MPIGVIVLIAMSTLERFECSHVMSGNHRHANDTVVVDMVVHHRFYGRRVIITCIYDEFIHRGASHRRGHAAANGCRRRHSSKHSRCTEHPQHDNMVSVSSKQMLQRSKVNNRNVSLRPIECMTFLYDVSISSFSFCKRSMTWLDRTKVSSIFTRARSISVPLEVRESIRCTVASVRSRRFNSADGQRRFKASLRHLTACSASRTNSTAQPSPKRLIRY
jgi:hypothetical protein